MTDMSEPTGTEEMNDAAAVGSDVAEQAERALQKQAQTARSRKPVLLTADDDVEVLRALDRDLKRKYSSKFRVVRANGGPEALEALKELAVRGEAVALLLVDQRMPGMTGVELLTEARKLFPDARRCLLTAYADTEAAIQAINQTGLDHYLLKPWDPPEERLFPVLDDLLALWEANRPCEIGFEGVRVVGHKWSRESFVVKDFLARSLIPYRWIDITDPNVDAETQRIVEAVGDDAELPCLPLVLFPDGSRLTAPTTTEIAEKVGLKQTPAQEFYDLVIIGAGPAGLAAAVYGASEGLKTLLIERDAPGGQAGTSSRIENYLGFPSGISGRDLTQNAVTQARRFGVEIVAPQEVHSMRLEDRYKFVTVGEGAGAKEIACYAILVATGVSWRKLDAPGVEDLTGAGVYYGAAMTEALSCKDDDVFLVGGANSAGQAAIYLARYARCVTILVRGDGLEKSMSQYLIDEIARTENIRVWTQAEVSEVNGEDGHLASITVKKADEAEPMVLPARALFIFIGATPRTECLKDVVARDGKGFILAGPDLPHPVNARRPTEWNLDRDPFLLETSVPGIFVAGDVRANSVKRVASGVGEGSIAVQFIHQYLATVK